MAGASNPAMNARYVRGVQPTSPAPAPAVA
jgi:hypothetical protein